MRQTKFRMSIHCKFALITVLMIVIFYASMGHSAQVFSSEDRKRATNFTKFITDNIDLSNKNDKLIFALSCKSLIPSVHEESDSPISAFNIRRICIGVGITGKSYALQAGDRMLALQVDADTFVLYNTAYLFSIPLKITRSVQDWWKNDTGAIERMAGIKGLLYDLFIIIVGGIAAVLWGCIGTLIAFFANPLLSIAYLTFSFSLPFDINYLRTMYDGIFSCCIFPLYFVFEYVLWLVGAWKLIFIGSVL